MAIFNVLFYLLTISLCVFGKFALSKSIDILVAVTRSYKGESVWLHHQQYTTGWIVQGRAVGAIRKEAKMFIVRNYKKDKVSHSNSTRCFTISLWHGNESVIVINAKILLTAEKYLDLDTIFKVSC